MSVSLAKAAAALDEQAQSLAREEGRLDQIRGDLTLLQQARGQAQETVESLAQVMGIFQALEETWHHSFEDKLAMLISRGLSYVFQEDMDLILEGKTHGDLSALEFKLVQRNADGSKLITDIIGAKGGGVVCMVGFMLRLIVVLSVKPAMHHVIFFDETFSHLSREYVPALAQLLRQLCDETEVQFVMITHEPAFCDVADVVYDASQTNQATSFSMRAIPSSDS